MVGTRARIADVDGGSLSLRGGSASQSGNTCAISQPLPPPRIEASFFSSGLDGHALQCVCILPNH
eukprot:6471613-Amphidinium_carterae.1